VSGYRQSSFDPNAFEQPGAPLRPYNWVQRLGMTLALVGLVMTLARAAGEFGWIEPLPIMHFPGSILLIIGAVLVNSRRAPSTLVTSEQLARNKRVLVITVAICAVILGLAAAIEFTGA
jgi:lysylphosphatidylglycerol synthetase-like protein (DUF2156 family)